ncbi:unnamed protein product [Phaeothamnion confervicola]
MNDAKQKSPYRVIARNRFVKQAVARSLASFLLIFAGKNSTKNCKPTSVLRAFTFLDRLPLIKRRQASRNYEILERLEAGIELFGTEVKSCRDSRISLDEGFAQAKNGQLYLHGVHIAPHGSTNAFFQHEAKRTRRLLLHKKEIRQLEQATATKGLTMVPLKVYFNDSNRLKVEIALGRGKDTRDKRDDIRERDSKRELQRVVKNQSWQHKD